MSYTAEVQVLLKNGAVHRVMAKGESRNEALRNLSNAAMGINVVGALAETLRTYKTEEAGR